MILNKILTSKYKKTKLKHAAYIFAVKFMNNSMNFVRILFDSNEMKP